MCISNPDSCFDRVEVTNFDLINNKCRGDCVIKLIKEYQIILNII